MGDIWLKINGKKKYFPFENYVICRSHFSKEEPCGLLHIGDPIGSGQQGTVHLAVAKNGTVVGLKILNIKTPRQLVDLEREIINLKKISEEPNCHPNISCYYDSFQDTNTKKYILVLKYYDAKGLDVVSNQLKQQYLATDEITGLSGTYFDIMLYLLLDLLSALKYIHDYGIVHGDLKLENILVSVEDDVTTNVGITQITKKLRPILIDFGLSCYLKDKSCVKASGSPLYMAPEIFKFYRAQLLGFDRESYKGLSPATDIWALGICFYAISVDKDIWPADIVDLNTMIDFVLEKERVFIVDTPNNILNTLLQSMLVYDARKRLSAVELLDLYDNLSQSNNL